MRALVLSLALLSTSTALLPGAWAATPIAQTGSEAVPADLQLHPYHPGAEAMFSVSSVLVEAPRELMLVDAQFGRRDAQHLVDQIRATGKPLRTIFISHGDPDYYFGLATLQDAFPRARIVATAATVAHIRATSAAKLAYWGPKMGADAPSRIVIPKVLTGSSLRLGDQRIQILGLDGPQPGRSTLWIPAIHTLLGGIQITAGEHVWMADTQTAQSHADWLISLQQLQALHPQQVIPGHYQHGAALDASALAFTAGYIRAFDEETAKAADSTALISAMRTRYPDLAGVEGLELSAKVAKGEMAWP